MSDTALPCRVCCIVAVQAAGIMAIKRQVLETGKGIREELSTTVDGKTLYYDLTVEPLHDAKDEIAGITVIALEEDGEAAFVNIVGNMDLEALSQLGGSFNIPEMDFLEDIEEHERKDYDD